MSSDNFIVWISKQKRLVSTLMKSGESLADKFLMDVLTFGWNQG